MSAPPVLSESPPPPVFFPEPDLGELLRQAWDLIRRRAWIVLVVMAVMVAGALARARLQVPIYQATATLIIEPEVPHVANPWDFLLGDSPSFYNSQYEILRSFGIARRATEVLGLEPTPETVAALRGRIRVEPVADSRLVRIRSRGSDPAVLAQEVNAIARAFIDHNLDARTGSAKDAYLFWTEQFSVSKAEVRQAAEELLAYKKDHDLVALDERQAQISDRLSDLNERLIEADLEVAELGTVLSESRRLETDPDLAAAIPGVAGHPELTDLAQGLSTLEVEQAQLAKRYRPQHPRMVAIADRISGLEEQRVGVLEEIVRAIAVEHRLATSRQQTIRSQLANLRHEAGSLEEQGIRYRLLQAEVEGKQQMLDVAIQKLGESNLSGNVTINNIRMVDEARPPRAPILPDTRRDFLVACLLGLALGLGLSLVVDRLDSAVRSESEVRHHLGAQVLGIVPRDKTVGDRQPPGLRGTDSHQPGEAGEASADEEGGESWVASGPLWHAYHDLKTTLGLHRLDHRLRTLLITSATGSEGKTTTAAYLGRLFAESGLRVLLVDADLYRPNLHRRFGIEGQRGLVDCLAEGVSPESVVVDTGVAGLSLLPLGLIPPNPAEILASPAMHRLVDSLRSSHDLVIVDSQPCSAGLAIASLGRQVDGVLTIVRAHKTSRNLARKMLDSLGTFGCNVLGVVLTWVEPSARELEGYGYGYGYRRKD